MDDIIIKVDSLTKIYKIYDKQIDRLKEALNPFKKKYHKEHYALNNITFEIKKGEIIGIVGTNGSGKSTLLKIITGVLNATEGTVEVNGKVSALLELGAGFNLEYTGIENIFFNGMLMGFTKEEMQRKLDSIIEFADIGDFIYQPVKLYSSGMFARLAFAVSINVDPDILIIDETLSVGDMYFQAKCMTKMKEMFDNGVTVIFVTHDTNAVKSLCHKTLYIDKGNFISFGLSEEVVDLYAKKSREEMNKENRNIKVTDSTKALSISNLDSVALDFIESNELAERVKPFRQGTGEAILTHIEVLDSSNKSLENGKFNEEVKVRLYIKYLKPCKICVGYHIRDSKNIEIIGSNTVFENVGELIGDAGDKIIVEFITKIPLAEGIYNISTVLSIPTIHNRAAVFVDYTENAFIFHVAENFNNKVWNKVYVPNRTNILKIEG